MDYYLVSHNSNLVPRRQNLWNLIVPERRGVWPVQRMQSQQQTRFQSLWWNLFPSVVGSGQSNSHSSHLVSRRQAFSNSFPRSLPPSPTCILQRQQWRENHPRRPTPTETDEKRQRQKHAHHWPPFTRAQAFPTKI